MLLVTPEVGDGPGVTMVTLLSVLMVGLFAGELWLPQESPARS